MPLTIRATNITGEPIANDYEVRTSHQLKLEPILYWLPMVRWIVHLNNSRVLRHVKRQAEAATSQ